MRDTSRGYFPTYYYPYPGDSDYELYNDLNEADGEQTYQNDKGCDESKGEHPWNIDWTYKKNQPFTCRKNNPTKCQRHACYAQFYMMDTFKKIINGDTSMINDAYRADKGFDKATQCKCKRFSRKHNCHPVVPPKNELKCCGEAGSYELYLPKYHYCYKGNLEFEGYNPDFSGDDKLEADYDFGTTINPPKELPCTCPNGNPKNEMCLFSENTKDEYTDPTINCESCNPGYHINYEGKCSSNWCRCDNGDAVYSSDCPENRANICRKCDYGYELSEDKQCIKVETPAADDATCVTEYFLTPSSSQSFGSSSNKMYREARKWCHNYGGRIATIRTPGEHAKIMETLQNNGDWLSGSFWIGGVYFNKEQGWVWDNSPYFWGDDDWPEQSEIDKFDSIGCDYYQSDWARFPNDLLAKPRCMYIYKDSGDWTNGDCSESWGRRGVCEKRVCTPASCI